VVMKSFGKLAVCPDMLAGCKLQLSGIGPT
jgi:hypothetical protein